MLSGGTTPADEWVISEREYSAETAGRNETVFALGNGYLGLRGNHTEEAESYELGTFVNGFHESWPIRHAESAYGFARVGQTIVNVPDAKPMELEVAGERFALSASRFTDYGRELDLRGGVLRRSVVWHTRAGARLRIELTRVVSFAERHVAAQRLSVTHLGGGSAEPGAGPLALTVISGLTNRDAAPAVVQSGPNDPRRAERAEGRTLIPAAAEFSDDMLGLAYRTAGSELAVAVAASHDAPGAVLQAASGSDDESTETILFELREGERADVTKYIAYFDGDVTEVSELVVRAEAAVASAARRGFPALLAAQREWLDDFWRRSDVTIAGQPEAQRSVRWCIFQLAQAAARADGRGIAAKGVTGSGYSGHYFWDSEVYALPFLAYADPLAARNALQMRVDMLPAARHRAWEMNEAGALFPWRTITGEEASAYYPAGTAQYHINADVCFAVAKYVRATGDTGFLAAGGIDIAVETARMWLSLGFWRGDTFHIHGVTGPDEYTAVVNDNFYTNAMARFNLRFAARALSELAELDPDAYALAIERLRVAENEPLSWQRAAAGMHIGVDEALGIHPQDAAFLDREVWDFDGTPRERYPLLLHFHPLVIYRHQVLKQADAVLALFLLSDEFTPEQKRADFEYYDPLTTGDSTLSGVVQAIIAAEVGYSDLAVEHFTNAWSVDLRDLHGNAADGVHVASAGGVWSALVYGFGGLRDAGGALSFDPRLPAEWPELAFSLMVEGRCLRVTVRQESLSLALDAAASDAGAAPSRGGSAAPGEGAGVSVQVRGEAVSLTPGEAVTIALAGQGPRLTGRPRRRSR
ncbi:glycoside hydrolase family 65 protein [Leucobacter albus]|uniref:Glycoside hydrolase family 65 protein n=1 Tax=Leucobacter albus TaxID=272210 RepID=A0ABW3TLA4_9MICO